MQLAPNAGQMPAIPVIGDEYQLPGDGEAEVSDRLFHNACLLRVLFELLSCLLVRSAVPLWP